MCIRGLEYFCFIILIYQEIKRSNIKNSNIINVVVEYLFSLKVWKGNINILEIQVSE